MKKIIFASGNKGKIKEIKDIFNDSPFRVYSLYDLGNVPEIEEHGSTFEENAKIKTDEVFSMYGEPCIADDSGLVIEQLGSRPGIHSARYAGENCTFDDNINKVLAELEDQPEPHYASFVSCAVYFDGNNYLVCNGEIKGTLIKNRKGILGFGYDPIFVPEGYDITMAEMDLSLKNTISHRGIAFRKLKELLINMEKNK
ncbi:MAG: RdgB/HAM1 family non-canonical purine NTP pyrophosphatase [bacterium]